MSAEVDFNKSIAVESTAVAFGYVKRQTTKVCWAAIKGDPQNILLVQKPTDAMIVAAVKVEPSLYRVLPDKYKIPEARAFVYRPDY
jgi:hypothetical protein